MSKFGWSYPAGAAEDPYAPYNQTDDTTPLQDQIYELLLKARISDTLTNKILDLVQEGEAQLQQASYDAYAAELESDAAERDRLNQEHIEWLEDQKDKSNAR